jgi:hypothetical protein
MQASLPEQSQSHPQRTVRGSAPGALASKADAAALVLGVVGIGGRATEAWHTCVHKRPGCSGDALPVAGAVAAGAARAVLRGPEPHVRGLFC